MAKKTKQKYHPTKLFKTDLHSLHQTSLKEWYKILFNVDKAPSALKVSELRMNIMSMRDSLVRRAGLVPDDLQKKISSSHINNLGFEYFQHYLPLYNCRLMNRDELIRCVKKYGLLSDDHNTAADNAKRSSDETPVRNIDHYFS